MYLTNNYFTVLFTPMATSVPLNFTDPLSLLTTCIPFPLLPSSCSTAPEKWYPHRRGHLLFEHNVRSRCFWRPQVPHLYWYVQIAHFQVVFSSQLLSFFPLFFLWFNCVQFLYTSVIVPTVLTLPFYHSLSNHQPLWVNSTSTSTTTCPTSFCV